MSEQDGHNPESRAKTAGGDLTDREFVTFEIGGQLFGADVLEVQDVFQPHSITPIPLARSEIAGLLNLRGRIVTAFDARSRLGLPQRDVTSEPPMAIGIERDGEPYGLLIDCVREVMRPTSESFEANPVHMDGKWADVARGVYRLKDRLLVVLDLDRLLDANQNLAQAA